MLPETNAKLCIFQMVFIDQNKPGVVLFLAFVDAEVQKENYFYCFKIEKILN